MTTAEIAYDLLYFGESDEVVKVIVETIAKLPATVAAFAIERCAFVSVGKVACGITLPGKIGVNARTRRSRNQWVILLTERLPSHDRHSIVAHEIAHAWLGHDKLSINLPKDCETKAAGLTKSWGFTGKGVCEVVPTVLI